MFLSFYDIVVLLLFLQKEQKALSLCPSILSQNVPHFIFPVSMHLMWSFMHGGTLSTFIPFSNFLFMGQHSLPLPPLPAFVIPLLPSLPAVCSNLPGMIRFDVLLTAVSSFYSHPSPVHRLACKIMFHLI